MLKQQIMSKHNPVKYDDDCFTQRNSSEHILFFSTDTLNL